MTKAAILSRVSTETQRDNSSHQSQVERCRRYCKEHGYQVVDERKEIASGALVLARTDLQALLLMASRGELDVIVVDIPDRLGRGDVIAQCELLARMNNCRIEYAQPGRDVETVEGYIQHAAEQMVSGIERHNIKRRTLGGKQDWAKKGRVIAPPRRPYGYEIIKTYDDRGRKQDCNLEIHPAEARVVRDIFDWFVHEGLTLGEVCRRLDDREVPRISDYDTGHRAIRDAVGKSLSGWPKSTIGGVLRNTLYKGEWQYGRKTTRRHDTTDGVRVEAHRRDGGGIIVPVPAIVTEQDWDLAQIRLETNKKKFMRKTIEVYALRGRLRCALCGSRMYSVPDHGGRYYRCYKSGSNYKNHPEKCPAGSIAAHRLEDAVWDTVCKEMKDIENLKIGLQEQNERATDSRRMVEQSLAALQAQIDGQDAAIDRYLTLYGKGLLTEEKYAEKKGQVDAETQRLIVERDAMRVRLTDLHVLSQEQIDSLWAFQAEISERLHPDVPLAQQKALHELLDVECIYNTQTSQLNVTGLFGSRLLSISSARDGQDFLGFSVTLQITSSGWSRVGGGLFGPGQD